MGIGHPTTGPRDLRKLDDQRYELCATFEPARDANYDLFWNHEAGRHCYKLDSKSPP